MSPTTFILSNELVGRPLVVRACRSSRIQTPSLSREYEKTWYEDNLQVFSSVRRHSCVETVDTSIDQGHTRHNARDMKKKGETCPEHTTFVFVWSAFSPLGPFIHFVRASHSLESPPFLRLSPIPPEMRLPDHKFSVPSNSKKFQSTTGDWMM